MEYFGIVLLIKHPSLDPALITSQLKLKPFSSAKAGEPRSTPKGTLLPGIWSETSWNHIFKYNRKLPLFDELERLLIQLSAHKGFFQKISNEGGHAEVYLQLPGKIHHGSSAKPSMLALITELGLHFGIEVFPEWGKESHLPLKGITKFPIQRKRSGKNR